jgi:hypothetical protein
MKYYTIYKITNLINNKIYVGVHHTDSLYDEYMGSGTIITKALKKYGIQNFTKEIIDLTTDADLAYALESKIVNEDFVNRKDTYNIDLGGRGCRANKGRKFSEEHKRKLSLAKKGTKHSAEVNKSKGRSGKLNGNARLIILEDSFGNIVDEFHGNLKEKCLEKGYPFSVISKTLRSNSKTDILYINSNVNSIKTEYKKYIGYRVYYK